MKFNSTKGRIVRTIKDLPMVWYFYKIYTERKLRHRLNPKEVSAEKVFTGIYDNNDWNNHESISGQGSILKHTQVIIDKLPAFLKKHQLETFLDAPCGDFNWMQHAKLDEVKYIGGDIVKGLVEYNNTRYSNPNRSFIQLNIIEDSLPNVDVMMVRDCLVHFNDESIMAFFKNLVKSNIKYLLTTNFSITKHNYDISMGNWRPINLQREPYNLPKEVDILWEESTETYGQFPDKALYLFRVADLKKRFA
jgi:hypothetical protein